MKQFKAILVLFLPKTEGFLAGIPELSFVDFTMLRYA